MTTAPHTNGVHNATDEAIDTLYAWMPPQPMPQSCPEALFSLTLKGRIDGHEALLTARGQTADEFRRNLQAIRGLLDQPAQPPAPAQSATPQCPQHGPLKPSTKGTGWYCPNKTSEGQWCPAKGRP